MAMAMEAGEPSRFTDVFDEPVDRLLSPIRGYEDKQLLPLTQAIESIEGFFNDIQDYVYVALHNCQNPADDLTQQESASIHLYTMQFHGGPSLYLLLNQSLRAENRDELIPWFSFLKLFLTALHKLPSHSEIVWRGIKNVDLSSKYKKGTKFAWWGVSSCTTDIEILQSNTFLGKHGLRTLFSIQCINGKSIANHSYFKNTEKEIILMPGSYFEVIGQLNPAPQLHIIQLKEITPPITFVKPPFSKSTNINPSSIINKSNTYSESTSTMIKQNPTSNMFSNVISLKSNLSQSTPSVTNYRQTAITMSIIERKAIDPSGRIGSLYNVYQDCLVESSYFKLDFKNGIRPSFNCIIEKGEKIECQNLLQFIGFDDDFRLSLKSNIVNPMGIASVVEYPYLIDECTRVFYYSYTIRQECSSSDSIIRNHIQQWTSKSVATHLITGIDIGIDIIVILRLTSADSKIIDDTLNKIRESLFNDTILSKDKISLDGIVSTYIYSNINDLTTKQTLIDVYQSICQIKNNFDVYQPTNYILSSIQSFIKNNNKNDVTFIPLKPTIVQKIEQDLFRFSWINRMWLTTLKDDKYDILNIYLNEHLNDVKNQLSAFKEQCTDENKRIQTLIINIRNGKYSENTLENEVFNENIQIKLNKNREDLIHSITTLKEKGLFIEALQKEEFKYENANKYDIKQNDNENTIQRKLIGNNQTLYFLCSNDTLNNNNLSTLQQFISKLRNEKKTNQNLKLIYVDFSYSPYELDQIKVFPLIHSIKDQNPHLSLLSTKKAIPRNPSPIDDKTINILFLGKSGVGKSTLINNLITYLKHNREENVPQILSTAIVPFVRSLVVGVDDAEEHRVVFGIHNPNENYDHPDQSTTQQCKLYSFDLDNNQKLCIIDTPGFGKTHHQNNNDDINMQHILSRIINLTHLNAICVIIESGDDKLDDYHSCLTGLFHFLGEKSVDNVLFCLTKVHSKDLNVNQKNHYLKLLVDSFLPAKIPLNENVIFDFDSSFFINSAMSNHFSSLSNPSDQISQQSWRTSKNGWNRLLTYIRQNLHRYSIQQGLEIVQLAKLEINQLIRPLLETIRNYFRNFILLKMDHSSSSIELSPISLLHPSAICYSCKRNYDQCAGFWIASDSPHEYRTTCDTCSCNPQQHVRIEYRLQFNCSNSQTQQTSLDQNGLLDLSVHLAYFLLGVHYTINNNPLLLYLNKMIDEERSICENLGSHRLNLALHDQLLNFRHNYQQQINTIKQKNIQNNFDIYDIIDNVKQIPMVKIQLDASRKLQETSV